MNTFDSVVRELGALESASIDVPIDCVFRLYAFPCFHSFGRVAREDEDFNALCPDHWEAVEGVCQAPATYPGFMRGVGSVSSCCACVF